MLTRLQYLTLLLFTLLLPACGIITAPISIPAAPTFNKPLDANGQVVDQDGQPLTGVQVLVLEDRIQWDWLIGFNSAEAQHTQTVDGAFAIHGRTSGTLHLVFQKDGYFAEEIGWNKSGVWLPDFAVPDRSRQLTKFEFPFNRYRGIPQETSIGGGGSYTQASRIPDLQLKEYLDPKAKENLQVVLEKHGPFTSLAHSTIRLATYDDRAADLAQWQNSKLHTAYAATPAQAPEGSIYLDALRDARGMPVVVPVPGYGRVTPQRFTLGITGPGNGFIAKKLAALPTIRQMKQAPAEGYGSVILPQIELERLLLTSDETAWFFVKLNGLYGRAAIHALKVSPDPTNPAAAIEISLQLTLWLQPDGTRNLETAP